MSRITLLPALLALIAAPAMAQDKTESAAERPWSISLTGGITAVQAQADQPFGSLSVKRDIGDAYVRGAITYVGSGDARGLVIPADTWIGTLGAGGSFGDLSLDGYVNFGRRSFEPARLRTQGGTAVNLDRTGGLFGIGATLTYDIAAGDRLFVSPFVGVDYNSIDFSVAVIGPGGNVINALDDKADGVTGTGGVAITHLFAGDGGSISLSGAFSTASNIAAVGQLGQRTGSALPRFVQNGNAADSWGEVAGTISFNVSEGVAIDLSVIQTIGFAFGDTTAGSATLRFAF
jgi:hypothetical protein